MAAVGREKWIDQDLNRPWRSASQWTEVHRLWLVRAMLESYISGCGPVSRTALAEWSVRWSYRPSDVAFLTERDVDLAEQQIPSVNEAFGLLGDVGLYVLADDSLALTPAGDVFVTAWLAYMER